MHLNFTKKHIKPLKSIFLVPLGRTSNLERFEVIKRFFLEFQKFVGRQNYCTWWSFWCICYSMYFPKSAKSGLSKLQEETQTFEKNTIWRNGESFLLWMLIKLFISSFSCSFYEWEGISKISPKSKIDQHFRLKWRAPRSQLTVRDVLPDLTHT